MASQWFYQAKGERVGPISGAELRNLAQRGAISAQTPIANTPGGPWVPASQVRGLFAAPSGTPSSTPATETAQVASHDAAAQDEPSGLSTATKVVMGVCGGVCVLIIGFLVWFVATRDTWEVDNTPRILAKLEEADRLQRSDPAAAYKTYDEVLREAKQHKIKEELFVRKLADAEKSRVAANQKVQEQIRAEEAEKQRLAVQKQRLAEEAGRRAAAEKQRVAEEEKQKLAAAAAQRIAEERQRVAKKRQEEEATHRKVALPSQAKPSDPVALFEELLHRVKRDGTKARATDFTAPGRWAKKKGLAEDVKYDVRKTDSIVSPIVASVTWKSHVYMSDDFSTREAAEAAPLQDRGIMPGSDWATFTFQEGRWVIQDTGWDDEPEAGPINFHNKHSEENNTRDWVYDWWWAFGGK